MSENGTARRVKFRQAAAHRLSQLLYLEVAEAARQIPRVRGHQKNPLMRHWFDGNPVPSPKHIVQCTIFIARLLPKKISLANFWFCITLSVGRSSSGFT